MKSSYIQAINIAAILIIVCLGLSPAVALLIGVSFSLIRIDSKKMNVYNGKLLKLSIILMGFGMSLIEVVKTSKEALPLTLCSVGLTLIMGLLLFKFLKIDKGTAILISCGTAICGGSAIAAIAPVINAKGNQVTMALLLVFIFNAVALFIFPPIGHMLNLSQVDFGHWSAIAIHDTSSVIGAGEMYGKQALEIGTSVKLTRALYIIPVSFLFAFLEGKRSGSQVKIPWFIFIFILALVWVYFFPGFETVYSVLAFLGKKGMVVALFLIGSMINLKELQPSGFKHFIFGILLWIFIAISSLVYLIAI